MTARTVRFLRSRKWAVRLLVVIAVYCAVVTALPQGDPDGAAVAEWAAAYPGIYAVTSALGLHNGFTTPLFLALTVWLTLATAACAWERSVRALAERGRGATVSAATLDRLRNRPRLIVPVPAGLTADEALGRARSALESLGMRTHAGPRMVAGSGRAYGAVGSPLFHWALVALFVVIALGQLSRAEGLMGVVTGTSVPDVEDSYRTLSRGPLHPEMSGLEIAVTEMDPDYVDGGVRYGPTPRVELRDDGRVLASGFVRPNAPLRYRTMMIHGVSHGLAVVVEVDDGSQSVTRDVLLDYETASATGVAPEGFVFDGPAGATAVVFDLPEGAEESSAAPAVEVRWGPEGLAELPQHAELKQGESLDVDGLRIGIVRLTTYARLSVVDDWSVLWIYALSTLVVIGSAIAVLLPSRAVWVLLSGDTDMALHVEVRHARGDPLWPARVTDALADALSDVRREES